MTGQIMERIALVATVIALAAILRVVLVFTIRRATRAMLTKEHRLPEGDDLGSRTRRILARAGGLEDARRQQRVRTLGSLLRNVVDVAVVSITLLTVLAILGVPMAPLLASAGIGGIAVGFGAQSLVKDYISGVFLLAEDQFGIGDFVKVGAIEGTVMQVTLRVTQVRGPDGTVWYVRNGEILSVGNVSQGFSAATVDVPVAADEDPDRVLEVLREAVSGIEDEPAWSDVLLEAPSILGVTAIAGGAMTFQILLKTAPNQQGPALREVRMRAKRACAEAGIAGPLLLTPPTGRAV